MTIQELRELKYKFEIIDGFVWYYSDIEEKAGYCELYDYYLALKNSETQDLLDNPNWETYRDYYLNNKNLGNY